LKRKTKAKVDATQNGGIGVRCAPNLEKKRARIRFELKKIFFFFEFAKIKREPRCGKANGGRNKIESGCSWRKFYKLCGKCPLCPLR